MLVPELVSFPPGRLTSYMIITPAEGYFYATQTGVALKKVVVFNGHNYQPDFLYFSKNYDSLPRTYF